MQRWLSPLKAGKCNTSNSSARHITKIQLTSTFYLRVEWEKGIKTQSVTWWIKWALKVNFTLIHMYLQKCDLFKETGNIT